MRKRSLIALAVMLTMSCTLAFGGEWESLVNDALKQMPSASKRRTRSGKRLLREKVERIRQIQVQVPILLRRGDYSRAEELLKESLKLTIEFYGTTDNMNVAEQFMSLGIVYMEMGDAGKAEEVFRWARDIGERIVGRGSYELANVYKFLAVAYYELGNTKLASQNAELFLSIAVGRFGPNSLQADEAKELLRTIKQPQR